MKKWEIVLLCVSIVAVAVGLIALVSLCVVAEKYELAVLVFIVFQLQFLIGCAGRKDWL